MAKANHWARLRTLEAKFPARDPSRDIVRIVRVIIEPNPVVGGPPVPLYKGDLAALVAQMPRHPNDGVQRVIVDADGVQ